MPSRILWYHDKIFQNELFAKFLDWREDYPRFRNINLLIQKSLQKKSFNICQLLIPFACKSLTEGKLLLDELKAKNEIPLRSIFIIILESMNKDAYSFFKQFPDIILLGINPITLKLNELSEESFPLPPIEKPVRPSSRGLNNMISCLR